MKFLWPHGGKLPPQFAGVLTSPGHRGVPQSIQAGAPWAADNQAFTRGFRPDVFFPWLESMQPYRDQCLFVTVPDAVGDAPKTLMLWEHWHRHFDGWPMAYVAQDGAESIPPQATALFVGGSTTWKLSRDAENIIRLAQSRKLHVHIGRINYGTRYRYFRLLPGADAFTCDGTRGRFDGVLPTKRAWTGYQMQPPLFPYEAEPQHQQGALRE